MNFIIQVANTQKLLTRKRLNNFLKDFLPKLPNVFPRTLKQGRKIRVISSHPFGMPFEEQAFDHWSHIGVDIFKVKNICPILRDVLNMAHYVMLSFSTVLECIEKGFDIDQGIDWILVVFLHGV